MVKYLDEERIVYETYGDEKYLKEKKTKAILYCGDCEMVLESDKPSPEEFQSLKSKKELWKEVKKRFTNPNLILTTHQCECKRILAINNHEKK